MKQQLLTLMRRWANTLDCYGHLDQRYNVQDFSIIGKFIRSEKDRHLINLVLDCRNCALSPNFDPQNLLQRVKTLIEALTENDPQSLKKNKDFGQTERYRFITRRMYREKVNFTDQELTLGELDTTLADAPTKRKILRIIEKRMAQTCHRVKKSFIKCTGRRGRSRKQHHYTSRAVSFQMQNIGCRTDTEPRGIATHWKFVFDRVLGRMVRKPKHGYPSLADAQQAAIIYANARPYEDTPITPYRCAYCGAYHIGHQHSQPA